MSGPHPDNAKAKATAARRSEAVDRRVWQLIGCSIEPVLRAAIDKWQADNPTGWDDYERGTIDRSAAEILDELVANVNQEDLQAAVRAAVRDVYLDEERS